MMLINVNPKWQNPHVRFILVLAQTGRNDRRGEWEMLVFLTRHRLAYVTLTKGTNLWGQVDDFEYRKTGLCRFPPNRFPSVPISMTLPILSEEGS